jgi:hypothetical protein
MGSYLTAHTTIVFNKLAFPPKLQRRYGYAIAGFLLKKAFPTLL